jgi:aminoglycoside 6'-N-acetyltransferase
MRDEPADYASMGRWLSDPKVLEFYGGQGHRMDAQAVRQKYRPRVTGKEPIHPCIIVLGDKSIGYLQYYAVHDCWDYEIPGAEGDVWAMDLFIGEPVLWGRGIGSTVLEMMLDFLFEACSADRVVIDPQVENPRAIRAYQKVGFQKVKILEEHEEHDGECRDCWLMETVEASHASDDGD